MVAKFNINVTSAGAFIPTKKRTVPRALRSVITQGRKSSWKATGRHFHTNHRHLRFTASHAKRARYYKRKGEGMPFGSKAFWRSYTGRKLRKYGHMKPLYKTGETERMTRTAAISSTSKGVKIKYPGARKFNLRHPRSRIEMNNEFRRIAPYEIPTLGRVYERDLDQRLKR